MRGLIAIVILGIFMSGCTALWNETNIDEEAELQKAYDNCLKREGKDSSKCALEKERLLQEQQWEILDQST